MALHGTLILNGADYAPFNQYLPSGIGPDPFIAPQAS